METLSSELARKLLNKDFANLVKRVQSGSKLSRTERGMLQNMAQSAGGEAGPSHAKDHVELATILGVSRQAISAWRKRKDCPQAASIGIHEVAAWREFMKRHDLKGGTPTTDEETALKARKLLRLPEVEELSGSVRIAAGDRAAVSLVNY